MKKLLLFAATIAVLFAGCSKGSGSDEPTPTPPDPPVEPTKFRSMSPQVYGPVRPMQVLRRVTKQASMSSTTMDLRQEHLRHRVIT